MAPESSRLVADSSEEGAKTSEKDAINRKNLRKIVFQRPMGGSHVPTGRL